MRYRKLMDMIDKALTLYAIKKKQEVINSFEQNLHQTLKKKLI